MIPPGVSLFLQRNAKGRIPQKKIRNNFLIPDLLVNHFRHYAGKSMRTFFRKSIDF
jgi:hypothetical protein